MTSTTSTVRRVAGAIAAVGLLASCGSDGSADDEAADDGASSESATTDEPAGTAVGAETDTTSPAGTAGGTASAGSASGDAPKLAIVYSAEWFDGSWGEAAYDGANALEEEGVVSEIALSENVQPGAEAERAMRSYAEDGFSPIIAHSFDFGDDVKKVAADFPDTIFVYAGGFGDVEGNVGDYEQPFYQASYLEGILAAGATEEGDVAGAAGFEIPACYSMYEAFLAGAREVRPETEGSFVAVGDWYDVQLAKEAAIGQADGGATMFVGCGQAPTFGQIEAANDLGGVSTGYVGDMGDVGESVLSSFVWNLDTVFAQMVETVRSGSSAAEYYGVGLADGGLEVVIDDPEAVSDEAMALYDQRLSEIQDGSFEVPFVPERG
ncbi:BMP family protein [Ilumatobacter sp.]|uniref:BMP family protein n=1 Tax=Ilumatobacter sp. TaxID=1967498 RepID=UPI003B52114C